MRPVLQQRRRLTNMESLQLVNQMVRADHGLIKFMSSTVRRCLDVGPQSLRRDSRHCVLSVAKHPVNILFFLNKQLFLIVKQKR